MPTNSHKLSARRYEEDINAASEQDPLLLLNENTQEYIAVIGAGPDNVSHLCMCVVHVCVLHELLNESTHRNTSQSLVQAPAM